MQSHGALLVMVDEQWINGSRVHRNLNAGGYVCWLIGPWRCTVGQHALCPVCPKPCPPVAPWPLHLDSALVAFAEGLDDAARPAPSASTLLCTPEPTMA